MKRFFKRYLLTSIGVLTGGIGGFVYYYFWGCSNGCPIKSNAETMIIYGAIMGGLLFNLVEEQLLRKKKEKGSAERENENTVN